MALRFSRLDRPAIRRLKPGEMISEHGITAERIADGDLRYSVNVMVDGRRIHRVIGRERDGVTRTQCEAFIGQARTDARAGRLSLPRGRKLGLTFAGAAKEYLDRLERSGGKNLVAKRRHFRLHLIPYFGAMRLDAITEFTIETYKKKRLDQAPTPATVNRELATLSHMLGRAVEWKWLDLLPAKTRQLPESRGRIVALTDDECDRLMAAAIASADPDLWLFVAFGLNTAMRHSEILAVRWDQLDWSRRRLFIPKAKAGERAQPITPELADVLANEREMRQDRKSWIFPSPRGAAAGHRLSMRKPFRAAARAAGFDPNILTPHVMRHTAITKLIEAGVNLPTVQRISGHKTLSMVLRYTHVHGTHIDQAIAALGRTVPQRAANETAVTVTQELHAPGRAASLRRGR